MVRGSRWAIAGTLAALAGCATSHAPIIAGPALTNGGEVDAAITMIRVLDRPGRIKLATVSDGNKYIQCRLTTDRSIRCEAAGALMQPSLEHVLTPKRLGRLIKRGWARDPSFGNYARTFPPDTSAKAVADEIRATLYQAYGADTENLAVATSSVADAPCPPRNGPSQNLAGIINDSAIMADVAIHACTYTPERQEALGPDSTAAELIAVYGPRVALEIQRLRLNIHRRAFSVFETEIGYLQCETQTEPDSFYCEAQSADSWPALTAVLTPQRIARLRAAGYADPGRAPNYSKTYLASNITDAALAAEVLTLLHDVYGYRGVSKLAVKTEEQ
jgi:hypothetical protein